MGLGIQYTIRLAKPDAIAPLLEVAIAEARSRKWKVRRRKAKSPMVVLSPHPKSEDVAIDLSSGLRCDSYVKTSFAPCKVHRGIVEFFDAIRPMCHSLRLVDETGYAKHRDAVKLKRAMEEMERLRKQVCGADGRSSRIVATVAFQTDAKSRFVQTSGPPLAELMKQAKAIQAARRALREEPKARRES